MFDTTNVTVTGAPAATDTPGAVFASSPLSDFTMVTPEVADANAYASSVSVDAGNGAPSAPTAGVVPSANVGVPDTDPVSTCVTPGARAATVPVQVTLAVSDPAGPNNGITFGVAGSAPGQVIPVANESVTVTFAKNDVPVFDTTNVTDNAEPDDTDTPGAVFASSPSIDFTMVTPAVAGANAYASSVSVDAGNGAPSAPTAGVVPSANVGVPDTDPVSTCVAPGARAATVPVQVTLAVSDPAGPNNGITFGVAGSAPGQVIPVANESVTVTFAKNDVPVFDTTNVTDNAEPDDTDTPGAVFASSPLSDFTMVTPAVAGANAYASSVSVDAGNGAPSAPTAGVVPSANVGVPDTDPVSTCVTPGARAATVPVQVTLAVSDPAGPNNGITFGVAGSAPGQVIPVANESVTVTFAKNDVPVLVTTNVAVTGAPAATDTPGAVFASSPSIDFTMVTPEVADANAYASSVSVDAGNGAPSAPTAGVVPSANVGVPDTDPVSTCVAPGARAATVPVQVTLAVSDPAGPNNGITFGVAGSAPGQVIPVANESVTATFAR